MAIENEQVAALERAAVIGGDGEKLGVVDGIYYDNNTDTPSWAAVRSGLFGHHVSLVPLAAASLHGDELHVPFDKQQLRSAPHQDPDRELTPEDEIELFGHYGVAYDTTADPELAAGPAPDAPTTVGDRDADRSAAADGAMTRSEERLRVHTESQAVGRVRLRKHVVTEYQQITVPVRREEIRIERVPVDEPDAPAPVAIDPSGAGPIDGSAAGQADPGTTSAVDDEQEIILYAERPVVRTETVAVERIRLGKRTVTDQETVGGEVRREEIELDTDPEVDDRR